MASIDKRPDGKWRARYRERPGGPQRARHFDRKVDAERFLTNVQSRLLDGSYIDPSAGQQTLRDYASAWQAAQVHRPTTVVLAGKGQPEFGPPKTEASVRTVPLPGVVGTAVAAHLESHPATAGGLVFTNDSGGPIRRNRFGELWRATVDEIGLTGLRFHDLRHFYASLLIRHGESVKVVQARLGHASASETLDTYSHLWPDNEERTRAAVDEVLGVGKREDRRTG